MLAKSKIDKKAALKIATKIGAEVQPHGKHQKALLYHNGKLVLRFGIRHGRDSGHGHLVGENHDLKLSERDVFALAECTLSKIQYFKILVQKGVISD
jgi:hypothetical protein